MTPKEKAITIFKDNLENIGSKYSDEGVYSHSEGSIAMTLSWYQVDQILFNFNGLLKPEYVAFDAIGERKFTYDGEYETHMTGYDMVDYWNEVRSELTIMSELENLDP
jgi:hypothetical protein